MRIAIKRKKIWNVFSFITLVINALFIYLIIDSSSVNAIGRQYNFVTTTTNIISVSNKSIISPTAAARVATNNFPKSRILNVKLQGDKYKIKLKENGRVKVITIDASSGRVLGF